MECLMRERGWVRIRTHAHTMVVLRSASVIGCGVPCVSLLLAVVDDDTVSGTGTGGATAVAADPGAGVAAGGVGGAADRFLADEDGLAPMFGLLVRCATNVAWRDVRL